MNNLVDDLNEIVFVGEANKVFRINANILLTSFGELTLRFRKGDRCYTEKTLTNQEITIGDSDITVMVQDNEQIFTAGQYVEFVPEATFFDKVGTWEVQLEASDGLGTKYLGTKTRFIVNKPT